MPWKKCLNCRAAFIARRPDKKYCGEACSQRYALKAKGHAAPGEEIVRACDRCGIQLVHVVTGPGRPPRYCEPCRRRRKALVKRAGEMRRKASLLGVRSHYIDPELVFKRDRFTCRICAEPLDMKADFPHPNYPTIDHILPLSKGGDHTFGNVQSAHFLCNSRKGNQVDDELALKLGRSVEPY